MVVVGGGRVESGDQPCGSSELELGWEASPVPGPLLQGHRGRLGLPAPGVPGPSSSPAAEQPGSRAAGSPACVAGGDTGKTCLAFGACAVVPLARRL